MPLDTDAAEVAEKLEEEPAAGQGAQYPRKGTPARAPTPPFKLSAPRPEPQTERLPLEAAPSHGQEAERRSALRLYALEPPMGEAVPSGAVAPGELPVDLQPLGQVQESFIVATNPAGLWIVDQHAAHERVLFDRHIRMRQEKKVSVQRLLVPIILELRAEQQVTYQEIAEELAANGFEVEPFGQRTIAIKAAPAETRADDVGDLMREILDNARQEGRPVSLELLRNKIAASVSCHAAIKVNMSLDKNKMDWLLQALAKTECPMTCPHGRPTVLRYGMKDLQKAFKRI
jgi:DNA mismatch repair protein MutL